MQKLNPFLFLIAPAVVLLAFCIIYPWIPYFGEAKYFLIWHKYFLSDPAGYWSGFGGKYFQAPLLAAWWFLIFEVFSGSALAFHLLQIPFALVCIYFTVALADAAHNQKLKPMQKSLLALFLLALPAFITDTLFAGANVIIAAFFLAVMHAISTKQWKRLYWLLPIFVLLHVRAWICLPCIVVFAILQMHPISKVLQYLWLGLAAFVVLLISGLMLGLEFGFTVLSQTGKPFPVSSFLTKSSFWLAELMITGRIAIFISLFLAVVFIFVLKKTFHKLALHWLICSGSILLLWFLIHTFLHPINSAVLFLPAILLLMAVLFQLLGQLPRAIGITMSVLVILTLVSGHFWRLPRKYPQAIDSSLKAFGLLKMEHEMYNNFMPLVRIDRYATYVPAYFSNDPFYWGNAAKPYFDGEMELENILVTDLTNINHNKKWAKAFSSGDLVYKRRSVFGNYISLFQLRKENGQAEN